jgi:DUF1680 family protein
LNGGYHVAERGKTFYYADYRAGGGRKEYFPEAWPCCSGTFIQDVADYYDLIYFHAPAALYINLFIPSELTWRVGNTQVHLEQSTNYPQSKHSRFSLRMSQAQKFAMNIRVPSWTEGMTFTVNEEVVKLSIRPGDWATIDRVWNSGDKVVMEMQWSLREIPVDREHPTRVAVVDGPVVLVERYKTVLSAGVNGLKQDRSGKSPLSFSGITKTESSFVPFYSVPFGEPYAMYVDL